MGYTTDFDGEFTVTPSLGPEHRAHLEALDFADVGNPERPGTLCHWKPLDQEGVAFGWDGSANFLEYRAWLAYLIAHVLEPWGYRLDGAVTWQGEEDDDRGVITVDANHITVMGRKRPWSESEPSHSRYWPPDRQARLLARFRAGVDQAALAGEFGTWPVLIRTRLMRFGLMPKDEMAPTNDWLKVAQEQSKMSSMQGRLDELEAMAAETAPDHTARDDESLSAQAPPPRASGPPRQPRRPIADPPLLARRRQALADLRAKQKPQERQERTERSED